LQGEDEPQATLFDLNLPLDESLEEAAQRFTALILNKQSQPLADDTDNDTTDYQTVDINHLKALTPRSIGVETLAWHAFSQLNLDKKLTALGFNSKELAAITGNLIGRMVSPGSERHTLDWLQTHSGLGELLDHNFATTSLTRLYTVTDKLLKHQDDIEQFLYQRECNLFDLKQTIVLYDLTNTFFEGSAQRNPKAQFGRSKEKRSDCPIVTMGLVLDGDGFPINSKIVEGNISEAGTLEQMIAHLGAMTLPEPPVVVMDAGIASEENIKWLKSQGLHYIVVSRKQYKERPDEVEGAVIVKAEKDNKVIARRVDDEENKEVLLYCHSEKRAKKDQAIRNRFHLRFEAALAALSKGLSKKGCTKGYVKVVEKIGRLKEKNTRVAQEYQIDVTPDGDKKNAIAIDWKRLEKSDEKDRLAGVYCLRSDVIDWSESTLWQTYTMLTDLEATFRSMKTELGLRPVYHQKEARVTSHLFITLLAYHLVHTLRYQLKQQGIDLSWQSIRHIMSRQQRLTITMPTKDKQQLFIRTTTEAETRQQKIYDALGITTDALGKKKTTVDNK
jgi:transposase